MPVEVEEEFFRAVSSGARSSSFLSLAPVRPRESPQLNGP
jgi:hypothetical protein